MRTHAPAVAARAILLAIPLGLAAGCATDRWTYEPDLAATLPPGGERSSLSITFPLAPEGNRSSGVVAVSARGEARERIARADDRRLEIVFFFDAADLPVAFDWRTARIYDREQREVAPQALVEGDPDPDVPPHKTARKVVVFPVPAGSPWNPEGFRLRFAYTYGHVTVTREAHFLARPDPYARYDVYGPYPYGYGYGYPGITFGFGAVFD